MTGVLKGVAALFALCVSTVVLTLVIVLLGVLKLILRGAAAQDRTRRWLAAVAEFWISLNNFALSLYGGTEWDVRLPEGLDRNGCYVVVCNHQSWADIPVLQRCFNRRIPFLRFFLKNQLIWVPFLGLAWWALDFPFMKRAATRSPGARKSAPQRDLEQARLACEKFSRIPVSMMSFAEGTRFRASKRRPDSPYQNLLPPRSGGIGQVLYALAEPLDGMVDVTIVYQRRDGAEAAPTLWDLVSGKVRRIRVRATLREIPARLRGRDARSDDAFRRDLKDWLAGLWAEKDREIQALRDFPA